MTLSKRRLVSFFMAFLMVFNMLPTTSLAASPGTQEIGSDPLKTQTKGVAYTVSLDLQNVDGTSAQVDLSGKDYHLYLCLKVQNGNNTEYKYYISPDPINSLNGVYTSESLSPTENFTDIDGNPLTDAFDIGNAQIVSLGLATFSGDVIPKNMRIDTAVGYDMQHQLNDSTTVKSKIIFADSSVSNHTLKLAVYDKAIGPYDVLGFAAEFGVVANVWNQGEHAETNFAVKEYKRGKESAKIEVDASGGGTVPFYIGKINNGYNGKTLRFAQNNTSDDDIYIDTSIYKKGTNIQQDGNRHTVTLINTPQSEVNQFVGNLITNFSNKASSYTTKPKVQPAIIHPNDNDGTIISFTDYPDNTTLYVDAGSNWFSQAGCIIEKLEGQTIVFNLPGRRVDLYKERVTVKRRNADGTLETIVSKLNSNTDGQGGDSSHNTEVENHILNHIIFNAYEATELNLYSGPAGLFLATASNSTKVNEPNGSGTGWIATSGTFENIGGEWHFFRTQRHYQAYKETGVNIEKAFTNQDGTPLQENADIIKEFKFRMYEVDGTNFQKLTGNVGHTIYDKVVESEAAEKIDFPSFGISNTDFPHNQNNGEITGDSKIYRYYAIEEDPDNDDTIVTDRKKIYVKVEARGYNKDQIDLTIQTSEDHVNWINAGTGAQVKVGTFHNY